MPSRPDLRRLFISTRKAGGERLETFCKDRADVHDGWPVGPAPSYPFPEEERRLDYDKGEDLEMGRHGGDHV